MDLTTIFYHVDEFCKEFTKILKERSLSTNENMNAELINSRLTLSEIMTIQIYFHISGYRTFKHYYQRQISEYERSAFPNLVSYNRFVELMQLTVFPLTTFMTMFRIGKATGINYIDSTKLQVCHNARISGNKVFKSFAARGKTSTGWFYGFKLHLIVNDYGEILSFLVTPGNTSDNNIDTVLTLCKKLYGKLFGDRGYISAKLFESSSIKD